VGGLNVVEKQISRWIIRAHADLQEGGISPLIRTLLDKFLTENPQKNTK